MADRPPDDQRTRLRDILERTGRDLEHRERFALEQRYGMGHTEREIAEMLGIGEPEVRALLERVLARLRESADEPGS